MINIKHFARLVGKVTRDNSPLILTTIGVTGTISTAIFTARATIQATRILDAMLREEADAEFGPDYNLRVNEANLKLTPKTIIRETWHLYIPPLSVAAVTVTCIIVANRVGTRRAAAMAAAYTTLDHNFSEYREKIVDTLGAGKERKARDELAQTRVNNNPPNATTTIITGKGQVPCLDLYANRWFECDYDAIQKAEIELNRKIQHSMGMTASVNEFYDILGLPNIEPGEELGWDADTLLDIAITSVLTDDGRPGLCMQFRTKPIRMNLKSH